MLRSLGRLTVVVAVAAVDLDGRVHAAHGRQRAPAARRPRQERRQQAAASSPSPTNTTDRGRAMGAGAECRGSRHLVGRERLGEGGRGRQAREVGRDLTDGADGTRTHVDGHVLLDGDGQTLSFSHSHRATEEDWSHKKRKTNYREFKKTKNIVSVGLPYFQVIRIFVE